MAGLTRRRSMGRAAGAGVAIVAPVLDGHWSDSRHHSAVPGGGETRASCDLVHAAGDQTDDRGWGAPMGTTAGQHVVVDTAVGGDADGDGSADLLAGARTADHSDRPDSGAAYVFFSAAP